MKDSDPDPDKRLFREAMRGVRPLRARAARTTSGARRPGQLEAARLLARRHHAQGDTRPPTLPASRWDPLPFAAPAPSRFFGKPDDAHDAVPDAFLSAGGGPDLLRGLRRGKWPVETTLDLHGSTVHEALDQIDQFLHDCLQADVRCVRIVHGKGMGSGRSGPVLKTAVRRYLADLACVRAWVQCATSDGGGGAIRVLLRPPRSSHPRRKHADAS